MPRIRSYALIKTVPFLVMAIIAAYQGMVIGKHHATSLLVDLCGERTRLIR
jgi:hypothetical protein